MQGKIHFYSIEDQGSTFWFNINLEKNSYDLLSCLPTERLKGCDILVFEKNISSAHACIQLLSQWKTNPAIAHTEKQWQKSLHKNYDSIVIGHSHNTDIPALLIRIQQAQKYTKNIIVLINSNNIRLYERLQTQAINHCLYKPINHKNFANALLENKHEVLTLKCLNNPNKMTKKPMSVLAVDDNPANLKLISAMLNDIATHIVTCVNGLEAVELAKKEKFDLIFMDIQMPRLDGINACSRIKQQSLNTKTPIIAVTAHAYPGEKDQFLKQGMDDCLAKPIDDIALQKIITRWYPKLVVNTQKIKKRAHKKQLNISFDWSLALQQSAGKISLAQEMLSLFLAEFSTIEKNTQDFIDTKIEPDFFAKILHKFHGGCCYAGVPRLINIIKELEKGMKKNQTAEQLSPELFELLDELENVKDAVSKKLSMDL